MDQDVNMILEGKTAELIVIRNCVYTKIIFGKTDVICKIEKGPIWDTTGSASVLEAPIRYIKQLGIQVK